MYLVLELPCTRHVAAVPSVPLVVCPFCCVVLSKQQLKNHLWSCKGAQLPNQSSSCNLSKSMYHNASTLIDIYGVETISPLHQNEESYLPQFSPNPVKEFLQYAGIQDTHQEFSIPQQEMGDRLDRERNELVSLAMGIVSLINQVIRGNSIDFYS